MFTFKQLLVILLVGLLAGGGAVYLGGSNQAPAPAPPARAVVMQAGPEAVARAYYLTLFSCGEAGAGTRYDLSTSPERDWTRATYLRIERRHKCKPSVPPAIQARLEGDLGPRMVSVLIEGHRISERLVLVQMDDGTWKVQTVATSAANPPGSAL